MIDKNTTPHATVLIIGSGGREHALAWKLSQCPEVSHIFVAPGNAGTALEASTSNVEIAENDHNALLKFAQDTAIDLTVVGPEQPLANGLVDLFQQHALPCCGPQAQAAQLESSKQFCKEFLIRHGIATAQSNFFTDYNQAIADLEQHTYPLVIKADGLAAGKGVVIAHNRCMAEEALKEILLDNRFGDSGVLIEQFLEGEEVNFIVLTDGETIVPMASAQDHKKRDEGDKGPNTGGMGAYSPAPLVDRLLHQRIMQEVIEPTVAGLAKDAIAYRGFLYAGLMVDAEGTPRVLEYNCRLGDPETQVLLMRIDSGLYQALLASATRGLEQVQLRWKEATAICVVLAASNYPEGSSHNETLGIGSMTDEKSKVFHAGTQIDKKGIISTNGGRVLGVTSLGVDIKEARKNVYQAIQAIDWDNKRYRKDIGYRALTTATTTDT